MFTGEGVMTSFFTLVVGGMSAVSVVASALVQIPAVEPQRSPMYDVKTETTITAVVESVESIAAPRGRGRRGLAGTHLVVRIGTVRMEVHLGPSAYLTEKRIAIAKGDALEILGSRITIDDEPVLLARQIKKGETTWTLRDATGRPFWSGRR
jgi:hypothetical protein